MRSSLKKRVFSLFDIELSARLSEFKSLTKDGKFWVWRWSVEPDLAFFIYIQGLENHDKFVLEIAWSDDGAFPWKSFGKRKIEQVKGRTRLGNLWKSSGGEHTWDLAPEMTEKWDQHIAGLARGERAAFPEDPPIDQLLPRIEPLVKDAVDRLQEYAIPLFSQIAQARRATD